MAGAGLFAHATQDPAVGPERYARALQEHLGQTADPVALAAWGWEELGRLQRELRREAAAGWPGLGLPEVLDRLDNDPAEPSAAGPEALLDWLRQVDQQVVQRLAEEFDIPPQLRVLRHDLGPPGLAAGAYYLPPTEDGARPGVVVWTVPAGRVPLWRWQTFSHHEGIPGHHLELGGVRFLPAPLTRFQSALCEISGYSEGWGLYAERFMDELGAFDRPATRMGFLVSQSFRAVRVAADTGLHLGLRVPAGLDDPAAGQVITPRSRLACWSAAAGRPRTSPDPRCCATWEAPAKPWPTRSGNGSGAGTGGSQRPRRRSPMTGQAPRRSRRVWAYRVISTTLA